MHDVSDGRRSGGKFDLVAIVLAVWMVGGVFIDGWVHVNLDSTQESFFTPWHGVLYSGFVALAAWMGASLLRERGKPVTERIPRGYRVGFVGMVVFAAGGAGDALWHEIFGIEVGIEALISPTHLLLLTGGLLLLTSPLRSAWRGDDDAPTLPAFLPALVSVALTSALLAFFFAYAWGGLDLTPAAPVPPAAFEHGVPGHREAEQAITAAILSRLLTTVLLIGPLLLLLRRWHPPTGTATVLFTTVSALLFALSDNASVALLVPPLVVGVVADIAIARVRPGLARRWPAYAMAGALAVVLWLGHFAVMAATHGLGWTPELWGGAVFLAALTAVGLAVLVFPPPGPEAESGRAASAVTAAREARRAP